MRVALLLLMVVLSGCFGGSNESAPQPSATTTTTTGPPLPLAPGPLADLPMLVAFDYVDCTGYEGLFPVDAVAAQALLPAGYTVRTETNALGATATLQVLWLGCEGFRTAAAVVNQTAYGTIAIAVEPLGAESDAWYRLRILSRADIMETLWTAAGYDLYVGEPGQTSVGVDLGLAAPGQSAASFGDYNFAGLATVRLSDAPATFTHHTESELGRLEWTGMFEASSFVATAGQLTLEPDDPAASLLDPVAFLRGSQRILESASVTSNDLWLRAS